MSDETKEKDLVQFSTTPQNRALSYKEVMQIGKAFVASGMFGRDMERVSQAITKIMAGQELGMSPFASMRAIHVIDGNATLSANTMAAMVKRSTKYDYTIVEKSTTRCEINFFEIWNGEKTEVGTEIFDMDEATQAGLTGKNNWNKYPKAMLFARCMSNGVRTYCPDVFNGMLVYTPDEMGGKVDESGDYAGAVDGEVIEKEKEPENKPAPEAEVIEEEITESAESVDAEPVVDEDFKNRVKANIKSLGLNTRGELWLMARIAGKPTTKLKDFTDVMWKIGDDYVNKILQGKIEVEDVYLKGVLKEDSPDVDATVESKKSVEEDVIETMGGGEVVKNDKNAKD